MFVTNWISTTKIQKISEITNFFRHYFLSRTEVNNKTGQRTAIPIQPQKGDRPPPVPKDERDISVDLVNNEANHFALYYIHLLF